MRPAFTLSGFTSHQLRSQKNTLEILLTVRVNRESSLVEHLIVYTDSKTDMDLLKKEVKDGLHKEAEMKIKSAVGFRHVIDLLSSEQKLIVGHNCFLDIAHIYSKFLGPLPSTAEEYVSSVHKYFPYIIDTKMVLNASDTLQLMMRKSSTSLSKAFALLCPQIASGVKNSGLAFKPCVKVEVQVDDMRSSNWNSGAKHEAGYDAFMTGCVFAQACSHLGIDFKLHSPSANLAHDEKLQKHINLLYLSWINGDIIDLRTDQAEAVGIKWMTKLLDCKVEAEAPRDESYSKEIGVETVLSTKSEQKRLTAINDPSCSHFSSNDLIDSLYPVEAHLSKMN
ncbi:hypothetical protein F0562_008699 [Nyssa sinensis]|uniref:Uncharacterized protein n=1 Tax=Nyssa sinensis TaxID=561372 RepID=A0A5J5AB07_9ASTE|nr:hypothetical protein F0562_008699 [Nyssa sinensis]